MSQKEELGNICHIEISVPDLKEAVSFYGAAFDWEFDTDMIPNYGLSREKEVSIGLSQPDSFSPSRLGVYVQVQDIEQTLPKIEKLGGAIESKKNLISENIGFGARFTDPFGNSIGLFAEK